MNIITIGEVLWDIVGGEEHLGGATFNFSAHIKRLGHQPFFVSAVGKDERGRRILDRIQRLGLSSEFVTENDQPTGTVTVELAQDGQPRFVIHRPAAYDFPALTGEQEKRLFSHEIDWIYFGTLHQMYPQTRALTRKLVEEATNARRFYDINLRPGCYTPELIRELMAQADIVKLNHEEVSAIESMFGEKHGNLRSFCEAFCAKFSWDGVCVTRGPEGSAIWMGGEYVESAGYKVVVADTVGAGDAFAAGFLHGVASGWPIAKVADFANRVGAFVASQRGAIPAWTLADVESLSQHRAAQETT